MLVVAAWADFNYGYTLDSNVVRLAPVPMVQDINVRIVPGTVEETETGVTMAVPREETGSGVIVYVEGAVIYQGSPFDPPNLEIRKESWLATVFPACHSKTGFLAPNAPFDSILLNVTPNRIIAGVPGWLATWEPWYFLAVIITWFAPKILLRVH